MDRELVFAVLVAALCGVSLMAAGWCGPAASYRAVQAPESERRMWRRIWVPFVPALIVFALLCGWVSVEPADAEPAPVALMLAALPFALVFVRALWRASRSLQTSRARHTIATVGFIRPRIILSPSFADAVDADAMNAAMEHERAHVRHRDPLRLWLAQFGTELQWPAPAAATRLREWRRALEIARDDEARAQGVAGPDLAAAILVSLRLSRGDFAGGAAGLAEEAFIKERVVRLLQPLEAEAPADRRLSPILFLLVMAIPLAILIGLEFGERIIGSLLTGA
jgi:Zn-dependent protease with chaperone function